MIVGLFSEEKAVEIFCQVNIMLDRSFNTEPSTPSIHPSIHPSVSPSVRSASSPGAVSSAKKKKAGSAGLNGKGTNRVSLQQSHHSTGTALNDPTTQWAPRSKRERRLGTSQSFVRTFLRSFIHSSMKNRFSYVHIKKKKKNRSPPNLQERCVKNKRTI